MLGSMTCTSLSGARPTTAHSPSIQRPFHFTGECAHAGRAFYGTFIALRHSCTLPVMAHAVEVRPYARGKLCCLTRHHFRACPTPAAVVTSKLIHNAFACGLFALEVAKTTRVSDPTPHLLSQHAITSTPGPRQVYVPITSLSALAFAHTVRAPRVGRHRRLYP